MRMRGSRARSRARRSRNISARSTRRSAIGQEAPRRRITATTTNRCAGCARSPSTARSPRAERGSAPRKRSRPSSPASSNRSADSSTPRCRSIQARLEARCAAVAPPMGLRRAVSEKAGSRMSALDDYLVVPKLSLLDKTRIQAQVLVPVLRALRSKLGKENADAVVKQALRDWSKQLFAAIADGVDGSPGRKWAAMHTAMAEITEHDVTVEMRRHDKEALEFDITHCRFAEFFRALGEPELGALLVCEADFDIAAAGGDVTFTRDQTI